MERGRKHAAFRSGRVRSVLRTVEKKSYESAGKGYRPEEKKVGFNFKSSSGSVFRREGGNDLESFGENPFVRATTEGGGPGKKRKKTFFNWKT